LHQTRLTTGVYEMVPGPSRREAGDWRGFRQGESAPVRGARRVWHCISANAPFNDTHPIGRSISRRTVSHFLRIRAAADRRWRRASRTQGILSKDRGSSIGCGFHRIAERASPIVAESGWSESTNHLPSIRVQAFGRERAGGDGHQRRFMIWRLPDTRRTFLSAKRSRALAKKVTSRRQATRCGYLMRPPMPRFGNSQSRQREGLLLGRQDGHPRKRWSKGAISRSRCVNHYAFLFRPTIRHPGLVMLDEPKSLP